MINKEEFKEFTKLYNYFWNVNFDNDKQNAWLEILRGLNMKGLLNSIRDLSKTEDYPPTIKKIVNKYDELKQQQEREIREHKIAKQEKYMLTYMAGQYECPICKNTGDFIYSKNMNGHDYDFYCRCMCARGKDLNKWSDYQITKDKPWFNSRTNKNEIIYIPDTNDIFTNEEIEIIKIKNSEFNDGV